MGKLTRILTMRRFAETYRAMTAPGAKATPGLPFAEQFAEFRLEEMRRAAKGG
ncbi:MAG: hypothetical protein Q8Q14_06120 [Gemmatimonadales bacterium]|nr:hypothetical protein [Gemmatimonadales bacterium]